MIKIENQSMSRWRDLDSTEYSALLVQIHCTPKGQWSGLLLKKGRKRIKFSLLSPSLWDACPVLLPPTTSLCISLSLSFSLTQFIISLPPTPLSLSHTLSLSPSACVCVRLMSFNPLQNHPWQLESSPGEVFLMAPASTLFPSQGLNTRNPTNATDSQTDVCI